MVPLHFLREGDLFLDIGANIGSFTVLAAGVNRARVWAFEPDPGTVRSLERNLVINNLSELVKVHTLALGDSAGEVAFTIGRDSMNQVAEPDMENVRMVEIARLDDLIGAERPVMIKMDIEGHEEQAVRGADNLLRVSSLKVIELETASAAVRQTLSDSGFEQAYYDPFTRSLAREAVSTTVQNSLYVRDWEYVANRLRIAHPIRVLGHSI